MGSLGWIVAASALALGCGKPDAPRLQGDVTVRLGDCAPPTVAFVSGARPQAFTPEQLEHAAAAALASVADAAAPTPPPPGEDSPKPEAPSPEPPAGGAFASLTGTADIDSDVTDADIYGGLVGNEAGETAGFGFGRSGFGPGGGGTGWGTIGTGRYGKIGHGSGTGTGYGIGAGRGGLRARTAGAPTVSLGQPNAQGDLDKAIIRRYIKRNIQKIQYCYEKQLLVKANLSGTVRVQFFIAPDGEVASANASGLDPKVAGCVADVIKAIVFPKPKGGGGVQVNYPFTFRPAEGSAPPVANDEPPPPEADDESGGTGTAMALDEGKMGKRDAERATAFDPDYRPGATTPLRAVENELVACFRLQTKRHGVAVVDLAASSVTAHGIDHPGFEACVGKLAKRIGYTVKAPLRCSVAFGPMAIGDAPGVDITANALMVMGTKISEPAAVVANDLDLKIESLHKNLLARKQAMLQSKAPVTLHGPLIIRPLDATQMRVVTKAMFTAAAAEEDAVLAAQRAGQWKLFRPIELPVVPVPVGTGGWWSAGKSRGAFAAFDETVHLSILVANDAVWIGLSRVNERQRFDAKDTAAIEAAIKAHKASAFFADRADIELAGEDDVTYGKIVAMIDLVDKLGFTKWTVMAPQALSSRFTE